MSLAEAVAQFNASPGELADEDDRLQRLADELARRGAQDELAQHLAEPQDAARLHAAALALANASDPGPDRAAVVRRLQRLVADPRSHIVAAAVDALTDLGDTASRDLVDPLLAASAPLVRTHALLFQAHVLPQHARPALLHALQDPDPTVRFTALDQLDNLEEVHGHPVYRGVFEQALHDLDGDVREHAQYILEHHFPPSHRRAE